jgi:hypothetical protein
MENPEPIRLKVIPELTDIRTIWVQKDTLVPVFKGKDWQEPDWECGACGNVLATGVLIRPHTEGVRFLPEATGGEMSPLGASVSTGTHFQSVGGRMVVECAFCRSFNELVPEE